MKRRDFLTSICAAGLVVSHATAALLNLARVYVTMSDRENARDVPNALLERKPGSTIAIQALGELDVR